MTWWGQIQRTQTQRPWPTMLPRTGSNTLLHTIASGVFRFQANNPFYGNPALGSASFSSLKRPASQIETAVPHEGSRLGDKDFQEDNFSMGSAFNNKKVKKNKDGPPPKKRAKIEKRFCFGNLLAVPKTADEIAKRKLLETHLEYHVQMRHITLFLLSCVYWGEGCRFTLAKTTHQNAECNCGCCHACHFCITPNVQDTFIPDLIERVKSEGKTDEVYRKCRLLGIDKQTCDKGNLIEILEEKKRRQYRMFSDNSVMFSLMNDCVQLYSDINYFDCLLESRMRPLALEILSTSAGVSLSDKGRVKPFNEENSLPDTALIEDPEEAVNHFVSWQHSFFERCEGSIAKKEALLQKLLDAEKLLHQAEKKGVDFETYLEVFNQLLVCKDAVEERSSYAPPLSTKRRLAARMPIVHELNRIYKEIREKLNDETKIGGMVNLWENWLKTAPADYRSDAHLLVPKLTKNPKGAMQQVLREYPPSFIVAIFGYQKDLEKVIQKTLKTPWAPEPLDAELAITKTAEKVRQWYIANTFILKPGELFCELKNGKTVPISANDPKRKQKVLKFIEELKYALVQDYKKVKISPDPETQIAT